MALDLFSSRSSNTTNATSQNASFSDLGGGSAVNVLGSENNITMHDGGAIAASFGFAQNFASDLSGKFSSQTTSAIGQAMQLAKEATRSESENVIITMQKYAVYGGIIIGAVMIVKAWKS